MGREKVWQGGGKRLEFPFLLLILPCIVLANGDVGCLFSKNLCKVGLETCYNDLAFGKCIPLYASLDVEDLYQYSLNLEELELLRLQLERLEIDGYKWSHPYTQCIMQRSLYNLRYRLKDSLDSCNHFQERQRQDFDDSVDFETDPSQPIAIVNFTPSKGDPHGDFADELYYPPGMETDDLEIKYNRLNDINRNSNDDVNDYSYSDFNPRVNPNYRNSFQKQQEEDEEEIPYSFGEEREAPLKSFSKKGSFRTLRDLRNHFSNRFLIEDENESVPNWKTNIFNDFSILNNDDSLEFLSKSNLKDFHKNSDVLEDRRKIDDDERDDDYEKTFARKYKYPKSFSNIEFLEEPMISMKNAPKEYDNESYDENESIEEKNFDDDDDIDDDDDGDEPGKNRKSLIDSLKNFRGMYTEGGFLKPERQNPRVLNPDDLELDENIKTLFQHELAGFKRRERLDVKKPGPPFSTNNYAFKSQFSSPTTLDEAIPENKAEERDELLYSPLVKKELPSDSRKNSFDLEKNKNVDVDHIYLEFKQPIDSWPQGDHIVREISKLLGLDAETFNDIRVGRAEVTFVISKNHQNLNATDVVYKIRDIREELLKNSGYEVIRGGIGDQIKLPPLFDLQRIPMNSSLFGALVAAGIAAACAAAFVTLVIARRHAKYRAKLAGLATPDPEASKDYQELCRVRMQAKQPTPANTNNEKLESPRITCLAREHDGGNSPSNRSSTSSWGEEPTLSNMDISTGHMVLSYMEDHLKNKDRLDQEWAALCAYEAEPSSTLIAENSSNAKYNRPGAALPFDHSRIILNDLSNANNMDYINASTITDHDPRNPAYIATQGPLPHTSADFWQLVWEQGSVVIVMLTRLTEDGRAMCHRYWPEEGSELYHIYEVHLVSEHIWCDDYLVRSFYLKNLRTGETRTVTQFHFLSWPENNVPQSTKALLEFRRKVNKSYRGRSCPIVVHCSDGAGRTGTYCLIDMVLNRMAKGAKEIDIAATLEHIRDQRQGMVATKQQFEFVLMAVAEEVHAILKALPVQTSSSSAEKPVPVPSATGSSSSPAGKSG